MKRRHFLRQAAAAGIVLSAAPHRLLGNVHDDVVSLTILHTNDVHSRMDPFPKGSGKYEGLGGVAQRASLVNSIRKEAKHVLLLDAGDMMQGTPYFNLYKGEVEFKAMNAMKYDVATIGNHDFDAGIDELAKNAKRANFDLVNANYRFDDTPLNGLIQPSVIKEFDGLRVGIFGVGIKLEGLVPKAWYGETKYTNPIGVATRTAKHLRKNQRCDYVICLSHLGYEYRGQKVSDVVLAQQSEHIDLIIGGHTHTFLDVPDVRRNLSGEPVIISQVGWAGIKLGRLDLQFDRSTKGKEVIPGATWVRTLGRD